MRQTREHMMEFTCTTCSTTRPYGMADGDGSPVMRDPKLKCATCRATTTHQYIGNKPFLMGYDRDAEKRICSVIFV